MDFGGGKSFTPQPNSSLCLPATEATRNTAVVAREQRWQCWDSRSLHTKPSGGWGAEPRGHWDHLPQPPKAAPSPAPPPQTAPGPGFTRTLHGTALIPMGWILLTQPLLCDALPTSLRETPSQNHPRTGMGLPRSALCHHRPWGKGQHRDNTGVPLLPSLRAVPRHGPARWPSARVWVFISLLPFHLLSPFHVSTFFSLQALRMLMSLTPAPTLALTGC